MANAAILGFGTVGSGVYEIAKKNGALLRDNALGRDVKVTRILDIRDFSNHEDARLFTKDFNDILNDDSIEVVAEVMGGLHPAYEYTKELLLAGKSVVTSNKELVATYGTELMELAVERNINYMFEASVGGGIPIIRPIHQCLTANKVTRIAGILNGTTNYILNEMFKKGKAFSDALSDAQQKGYAERNPAADIEGHDACRKIAILASLVSKKFVDYNNIETVGITDITLEDVKYAEKLNSVIKLIGLAEFDESGDLYSMVSPMLISNDRPLAGVDGVFNAVTLVGDSVDELMFYGRGAGKLPTASAVVADLVDCVRHANTSKNIKWSKEENKVLDPGERNVRFFVRTTDSKANAEAIFNAKTVVDGVVDGEIGFITDIGKEAELLADMSKLSAVVSKIRLLD